MEEFNQLYICPTCNSIKVFWGLATNKEAFLLKLPIEIECRIDACQDNALPVDKICLSPGHVHGNIYFRENNTGLIFCSIHKEEFKWIQLNVENVINSLPDKDDPTRRENW